MASGRVAVIGDIHGDLRGLQEILAVLSWMPLDEIWSLGDVVDRGPNPAECVALVRGKLTGMIMGNHEHMLLAARGRALRGDRARSAERLSAEDWSFLERAPVTRSFPAINTVLVHGGLWPAVPIERQPQNVIRAQMVSRDPAQFGQTRWWGESARKQRCGKTEAQLRAEGWERWYRLWDGEQDVCYGHSVFAQPCVMRNKKAGRTIGIDTGNVFGGCLTAAILDGGEPRFVSVKADAVYHDLTERSLLGALTRPSL